MACVGLGARCGSREDREQTRVRLAHVDHRERPRRQFGSGARAGASLERRVTMAIPRKRSERGFGLMRRSREESERAIPAGPAQCPWLEQLGKTRSSPSPSRQQLPLPQALLQSYTHQSSNLLTGVQPFPFPVDPLRNPAGTQLRLSSALSGGSTPLWIDRVHPASSHTARSHPCSVTNHSPTGYHSTSFICTGCRCPFPPPLDDDRLSRRL